ncbi:two-component sensor histidine kinase, partial [Aliarcobacter butzleri]
NQLINEVNSALSSLDISFERMSQYSSGAAHALKTPPTIIKGEMEVTFRADRPIIAYQEALKASLEEIPGTAQATNAL